MTPAPDAPAPHRHRCMRCGEEFECRTPGVCQAQYDVLPTIVTLGADGQPVVTEHCPRPAPDAPAPGRPAPDPTPRETAGEHTYHTQPPNWRGPFLPGRGNNDGRVRGSDGFVLADCGGDEWAAEYTAHVLNEFPALRARLAAAEQRAADAERQNKYVWRQLERWRAAGDAVAGVVRQLGEMPSGGGYKHNPMAIERELGDATHRALRRLTTAEERLAEFERERDEARQRAAALEAALRTIAGPVPACTHECGGPPQCVRCLAWAALAAARGSAARAGAGQPRADTTTTEPAG